MVSSLAFVVLHLLLKEPLHTTSIVVVDGCSLLFFGFFFIEGKRGRRCIVDNHNHNYSYPTTIQGVVVGVSLNSIGLFIGSWLPMIFHWLFLHAIVITTLSHL